MRVALYRRVSLDSRASSAGGGGGDLGTIEASRKLNLEERQGYGETTIFSSLKERSDVSAGCFVISLEFDERQISPLLASSESFRLG